MNVHQWTPVTRDWIHLEDITVDGVPVTAEDLTVALVPPRTSPTADTGWIPVSEHPDGGPALLVAGGAADPTDAAVITGDVDLWGRLSNSGTVVPAKLARITYSGTSYTQPPGAADPVSQVITALEQPGSPLKAALIAAGFGFGGSS